MSLSREIDVMRSIVNSLYTDKANELSNNRVTKKTYTETRYSSYEDENSYYLEIPLVGVLKEDISVEAEEGLLKVNAKANKNVRISTDYSRSWLLHGDADYENVAAKLENGVLTVQIAKLKPVKKNVNVKVN